MAESLTISSEASKEERYAELLPQLRALIDGEPDLIANLANIAAALKQTFHFLWVGFYLVKNNELVLGPFQGPVACTRILPGKGVCGKAMVTQKIIRVDDVDSFPGHIACSALSRSEIVIPVCDLKGHTFLVLDIDSDELAAFDHRDEHGLQAITELIAPLIVNHPHS
jgi:GAF domain-containing protein